MKRLWAKKQYSAFGLVVLLLVFISVMSISSIQLLQGNARVVNFVGIVRGATQKLIKEEIMGWMLLKTKPEMLHNVDWYPNDALVRRLDSIVDELLTGNGPNDLVVLQDEAYLANMRAVQKSWAELKEHIALVRRGAEPDTLFNLSQQYFVLVNETVFSAESYSEAQVNRINRILFIVNTIVILMLIAGIILYARSIAIKRRADALGEIAYIDHLTKLNNRTRCEQLIEQYKNMEEDAVISVFMFDMNDLKLTNDFFGHKGGDRIITAFADILRKKAEAYGGFVGRFGGDEFLMVLDPGNDATSRELLCSVQEEIHDYNGTQTNKLEMIRYAAGYVIANAREQDIEDIIHDADNQMYENKRSLKNYSGGEKSAPPIAARNGA